MEAIDFELILFTAALLTGVVSLLYWLVAERKRKRSSKSLPWLVDFARSLFPVILLVFVLRAFLVEPFRIPSGSMLPTLLVDDFILVNKFTYGIRLPVVHTKVLSINSPERGDVVVFRYPLEPRRNYIKRVIGLPGDIIEYRDKRLTVNGEAIALIEAGDFPIRQKTNDLVLRKYSETIGESEHEILLNPNRSSRDLSITVPENQFFVMGDNRDHSNDSRYWGFVPEENLVGEAFFIWLSLDGGINFDRIGQSIE